MYYLSFGYASFGYIVLVVTCLSVASVFDRRMSYHYCEYE
eukprot:COSAG02_NODE_32790_length_510_cov_1.746959_1_plen_39_part_01